MGNSSGICQNLYVAADEPEVGELSRTIKAKAVRATRLRLRQAQATATWNMESNTFLTPTLVTISQMIWNSNLSFPRRRESSDHRLWIPTFAGMTRKKKVWRGGK